MEDKDSAGTAAPNPRNRRLRKGDTYVTPAILTLRAAPGRPGSGVQSTKPSGPPRHPKQ